MNAGLTTYLLVVLLFFHTHCFGENIHLYTAEIGESIEAYDISPDSETVVFCTRTTEGLSLKSVPLNGGETKLLGGPFGVNNRWGSGSFRFSNDSAWIAYLADTGLNRPGGINDLYLASSTGDVSSKLNPTEQDHGDYGLATGSAGIRQYQISDTSDRVYFIADFTDEIRDRFMSSSIEASSQLALHFSGLKTSFFAIGNDDNTVLLVSQNEGPYASGSRLYLGDINSDSYSMLAEDIVVRDFAVTPGNEYAIVHADIEEPGKDELFSIRLADSSIQKLNPEIPNPGVLLEPEFDTLRQDYINFIYGSIWGRTIYRSNYHNGDRIALNVHSEHQLLPLEFFTITYYSRSYDKVLFFSRTPSSGQEVKPKLYIAGADGEDPVQLSPGNVGGLFLGTTSLTYNDQSVVMFYGANNSYGPVEAVRMNDFEGTALSVHQYFESRKHELRLPELVEGGDAMIAILWPTGYPTPSGSRIMKISMKAPHNVYPISLYFDREGHSTSIEPGAPFFRLTNDSKFAVYWNDDAKLGRQGLHSTSTAQHIGLNQGTALEIY